MPKKTRRHKRAAQERRFTQLFQKHAANSATDISIKTFFIRDLVKSLVIVTSIIALEIALYFGTINNYFPNLIRF